MFERLMIQKCDNVIPEEKRDPQLIDKLLSEAEIFISVAIRCLRASIKRGYKFTESERVKQNRENYAMMNDSLAMFVTKYCEIDKGSTPTKIFKDKYRDWCKQNGYHYEKRNDISSLLAEKFGVEKYKSNTDCYRLTIKDI